MNQSQAIALADELSAEASTEDTRRAYLPSQSANSPDVWCVVELDMSQMATPALQVWVSPEVSFPL